MAAGANAAAASASTISVLAVLLLTAVNMSAPCGGDRPVRSIADTVAGAGNRPVTRR
jgi:hypothetical protein